MATSPVPNRLPDGLHLVRVTPAWTERTVPGALLANHRVADGVWGLIRVVEGGLSFVAETDPAFERRVGEGETQPVPPGVTHRVVLEPGTRFEIEFHSTRPAAPAQD